MQTGRNYVTLSGRLNLLILQRPLQTTHPKTHPSTSRRLSCCCNDLSGFYFACHFTALLLSLVYFIFFILSVLLLYEQSLNLAGQDVQRFHKNNAGLDWTPVKRLIKDKFTLKDNRRQNPEHHRPGRAWESERKGNNKNSDR